MQPSINHYVITEALLQLQVYLLLQDNDEVSIKYVEINWISLKIVKLTDGFKNPNLKTL